MNPFQQSECGHFMNRNKKLMGQNISLPKFDLNLLTLFKLVYFHKSVSKAADLLDISASAVSQSLRRLRVHFDDPLFVRHGAGIEATTFATRIYEELQKPYDDLLIKLQDLSPTRMQAQINISCSPYLSLIIMGPLTTIINRTSPECNIFHMIDDNFSEKNDEALTYRTMDIIFDIHPYYNLSRVSTIIAQDELVFICAKDHPRMKGVISREDLWAENFTLLGTDKAAVAKQQNEHTKILGAERNIKFSAGSSFAAIAMICASETVGIMTRRMVDMFTHNFPIRVIETDVKLPSMPIYMIYNKTALKNELLSSVIRAMENEYPDIDQKNQSS